MLIKRQNYGLISCLINCSYLMKDVFPTGTPANDQNKPEIQTKSKPTEGKTSITPFGATNRASKTVGLARAKWRRGTSN